MPNPTNQYSGVPIEKSIRFFMIMLPLFLERVKPASTAAKPACIKNTSAAPISVHMVLTSENNSVTFVFVIITTSFLIYYLCKHTSVFSVYGISSKIIKNAAMELRAYQFIIKLPTTPLPPVLLKKAKRL